MAYADYDFYVNTYKGKLSRVEFERLSERASDIIDSRTAFFISSEGLEALPDQTALRVKKAVCALSEIVSVNEKGGVISSEKTGDYSVTYASGSASSEQRINNVLAEYIPELVRAVRWI